MSIEIVVTAPFPSSHTGNKAKKKAGVVPSPLLQKESKHQDWSCLSCVSRPCTNEKFNPNKSLEDRTLPRLCPLLDPNFLAQSAGQWLRMLNISLELTRSKLRIAEKQTSEIRLEESRLMASRGLYLKQYYQKRIITKISSNSKPASPPKSKVPVNKIKIGSVSTK